MDDAAIECLKWALARVSKSKDAWIAHRCEEATRHDGFGGNKRFRPVFNKVSHIADHEGEPVAWLERLGECVALWACEPTEFFYIRYELAAPPTEDDRDDE